MLETLLARLPAKVRSALESVGLAPGSPERAAPRAGAGAGGVTRIGDFGANPGDLAMKLYVPPARPRPGGPLLVLLHGCGQEADRFAADSGWAALADRLGAPLLLPEQTAGNNRGRCFNWFEPGDIARDAGEAASIRHMVATAATRL